MKIKVKDLKKYIKENLSTFISSEDVDRLHRAADHYGETEFEEGDVEEGVGDVQKSYMPPNKVLPKKVTGGKLVGKFVKPALPGKSVENEDIDRLNRADDNYGETEFEEAVDQVSDMSGPKKSYMPPNKVLPKKVTGGKLVGKFTKPALPGQKESVRMNEVVSPGEARNVLANVDDKTLNAWKQYGRNYASLGALSDLIADLKDDPSMQDSTIMDALSYIANVLAVEDGADQGNVPMVPSQHPVARMLLQVEGKRVVAEKAPPGREKQVKALKKKSGVNPYAIAWSSYKKSKTKKKK